MMKLSNLLQTFISNFLVNLLNLMMRYPVDCLNSLSLASEEQCQLLLAPITSKDINDAMFNMKFGKAPVPDGFTEEFFKENWGIVRDDVVAAIQYCFEQEYIYFPMNITVLTLVPKVENAMSMKDFRPITNCNVVYKCYSAILSSRLKKIMDGLISCTQNAFIPGRNITDNVLLMNEIVRNYHRAEGKPRAVIKVDIMKAYDTLNWRFLFIAMKYLGFPEKFIRWGSFIVKGN
ncbi:hypothetical protein ACH5RR_013253 [Cinchona calisaya]|uniref:Reverse transcriptase domain-containing protein n=1 Tax=Cinchona calisaya TaxID=153742 RepID=A0ABD2ZZI8_9GENT